MNRSHSCWSWPPSSIWSVHRCSAAGYMTSSAVDVFTLASLLLPECCSALCCHWMKVIFKLHYHLIGPMTLVVHRGPNHYYVVHNCTCLIYLGKNRKVRIFTMQKNVWTNILVFCVFLCWNVWLLWSHFGWSVSEMHPVLLLYGPHRVTASRDLIQKSKHHFLPSLNPPPFAS